MIESGTDPLGPTITVDGVDVAVAIRSRRRQRRGSAGQRGARGPGPAARAAARRSSATAASSSRAATSAPWSAPTPPVKVFLTADAGARAARRAAEEGGADVAATQESLLARDRIDSGRAPRRWRWPTARVHIDTTPYTLDEVVDQVVALVRGRSEATA